MSVYHRSGLARVPVGAYLFAVVLVVVYAFPLVFALMTSLKSPLDFLKTPLTLTRPSCANFPKAWESAHLGNFLANSLVYVTVCTLVSLAGALVIAFPVAHGYVRHPGALSAFMLAGLLLPDGTIPLFQMTLKLGLYNTRPGYMLAMLSIGGLNFTFLVAYLKGLPKDLDEAAILDGCGYLRFVVMIAAPLAKPALASLGILTAIGVWNDIARAIVFLSDSSLYPITKGLYVFSGQYSTNWPLLTAALIIVAAPLVLLYGAMQKHIIGGITAGAVKA